MRRFAWQTIIVPLLFIFFPSAPFAQPPPDPRDSVILESKCVAPNLSGTPAFVLRVYITNKDSLTYFTLSLKESTATGSAYALLNRTSGGSGNLTYSSVVTPLTGTLRYFAGTNFSQYNDNSPDRFLVAAGFDPGNPNGTIEPPNSARKPIWELKFRHTSDSIGLVELDTIKTTVPTLFTTTEPRDLIVNFVKGYIGISSEPAVFLLTPPDNGGVCQLTPTLRWQSISFCADSLTANYRAIIAGNPSFSPADTSPVLSETTYTVPTPLVEGASYYWKVFAVFNNGDTIVSTESREFSVFPNSPPDPFNLLTPSNGNKIVHKAITFDWQNALDSNVCQTADTPKYTLYIGTDSSFSSGFLQQGIESSSFTLTGGELNRGMKYFWRVKAYDPQDSATFSNNILYFDFFELGDANTDLQLAPVDIVLFLNYLFYGFPPILPVAVVDMNCDGGVNTTDLVLALNAVFLAEQPPCDP